ncbi:unnamed protein product [Auanema sp. JU1783]|nr:unnamed protein product [Auanema sp. JU1783]
MSSMINNLGTKLFKSVTDKAGDLGDKFESEFSRLSQNITAEVDSIVTEVISLSAFIKFTLVILCVLLIFAIIRLGAFGWRCIFYKAKSWLKVDENRPPPQVILLMPTENGHYRRSSLVYTDQQTKNILDRLERDSLEIFNEYDSPPKKTSVTPLKTREAPPPPTPPKPQSLRIGKDVG